MKHIAGLIVLFWWLAGIAIAKGVISTLCSMFVPPYAFYLVVERLIRQ